MQKREAVEYLLAAYRVGVRRGCELMMQSRTVYHYRSCRYDRALTRRIREIAEAQIRYGCELIHILPRRKGCRQTTAANLSRNRWTGGRMKIR